MKRQMMTRWLRGLVVLVVLTATGCLDPVGGIFPGPITVVGGPIWLPDGERIVFYLAGKNGPGGYYLVDADGGRLQLWRDLEPDNADRRTAQSLIRAARKERLVGLARLQRIGVRTTGRWPGGATKELVFAVAWSPDRQQIAYSYRSPGRTGQDVYVVRADGGSKPRLVAAHADGPAWSPDGHLLAVSRGVYGIFVGSAPRGRHLRKLTIEVEAEPGVWRSPLNGPTWSPDGTEMAFSTSYGLYVVELETGSVRRLADIGDA